MPQYLFVDPEATGAEVISVGGACYARFGPADEAPTIFEDDIDAEYSDCDECEDGSSSSDGGSSGSGSSESSSDIIPPPVDPYACTCLNGTGSFSWQMEGPGDVDCYAPLQLNGSLQFFNPELPSCDQIIHRATQSDVDHYVNGSAPAVDELIVWVDDLGVENGYRKYLLDVLGASADPSIPTILYGDCFHANSATYFAVTGTRSNCGGTFDTKGSITVGRKP